MTDNPYGRLNDSERAPQNQPIIIEDPVVYNQPGNQQYYQNPSYQQYHQNPSYQQYHQSPKNQEYHQSPKHGQPNHNPNHNFHPNNPNLSPTYSNPVNSGYNPDPINPMVMPMPLGQSQSIGKLSSGTKTLCVSGILTNIVYTIIYFVLFNVFINLIFIVMVIQLVRLGIILSKSGPLTLDLSYQQFNKAKSIYNCSLIAYFIMFFIDGFLVFLFIVSSTYIQQFLTMYGITAGVFLAIRIIVICAIKDTGKQISFAIPVSQYVGGPVNR